MKKRNGILTLSAALLVLLCACGGKTDGEVTGPADTTNAPETEVPPAYELPDTDWQGEAFSMLVGEGHNESLVEGETGDALDDAKWKMQRTVEEALNVTISETASDFWQMNQTVKQYIMAGEDTYDAIAMMDRFALTSAMENCFIPIQDVETITTDAVYWGGELTSRLSIGGNVYFAIGSMNLKAFTNTSCVLMNTALASAHDIEIPYDDVFAGTWTMEDFYSYRGAVNKDLNGDGKMDFNDQYTYGGGDNRGLPSQFWQACGISVISKNADDVPQITVWDDQKYFDLLEDLFEHLYSGDNDVRLNTPEEGGYSTVASFLAGRTLLLATSVGSINTAREMEDDFAVLPMPKYDEDQTSYLSRTYDATFFMVPITQADTEFSGAVLDALSCVGYYDLLPVYIETVLKDKASRDENSKKSIQICFDTKTLDMAEAFMFDYFGDQPLYDDVFNKNQFALSSYLEKNRKKVEKLLDKIVNTFDEIG